MNGPHFIAIPVYADENSVRVNITEIARYCLYDKYRPGDGSMVFLKDGTKIHTSATCEQIDEALPQ